MVQKKKSKKEEDEDVDSLQQQQNLELQQLKYLHMTQLQGIDFQVEI